MQKFWGVVHFYFYLLLSSPRKYPETMYVPVSCITLTHYWSENLWGRRAFSRHFTSSVDHQCTIIRRKRLTWYNTEFFLDGGVHKKDNWRRKKSLDRILTWFCIYLNLSLNFTTAQCGECDCLLLSAHSCHLSYRWSSLKKCKQNNSQKTKWLSDRRRKKCFEIT